MHHDGDQSHVLAKLKEPLDALLAEAALPAVISRQLRSDACTMSEVVASLCPSATKLDVKIEIFGENSCSRWHQDQYVGRGIISYTGKVGTDYTSDANVDFWELKNCGNNACIIRDTREIRSVDVGDFFFIKGTMFPGTNGLSAAAAAFVVFGFPLMQGHKRET